MPLNFLRAFVSSNKNHVPSWPRALKFPVSKKLHAFSAYFYIRTFEARGEGKMFRSIANFLRNLFVVSWYTLRNLTYFCSVFLIFLTDKKPVRNFFDQKLPKSEETF